MVTKKNVLVDIEATDIIVTWTDEVGYLWAELLEQAAEVIKLLSELTATGGYVVSIRSNRCEHPVEDTIRELFDVVELKKD
ncbi:MAG: hypothetical protein ACRCZZ_07805 [Phocaeicola sp.]